MIFNYELCILPLFFFGSDFYVINKNLISNVEFLSNWIDYVENVHFHIYTSIRGSAKKVNRLIYLTFFTRLALICVKNSSRCGVRYGDKGKILLIDNNTISLPFFAVLLKLAPILFKDRSAGSQWLMVSSHIIFHKKLIIFHCNQHSFSWVFPEFKKNRVWVWYRV